MAVGNCCCNNNSGISGAIYAMMLLLMQLRLQPAVCGLVIIGKGGMPGRCGCLPGYKCVGYAGKKLPIGRNCVAADKDNTGTK